MIFRPGRRWYQIAALCSASLPVILIYQHWIWLPYHSDDSDKKNSSILLSSTKIGTDNNKHPMLGLSQVYSGLRVVVMYSGSIYFICSMKPGIDDGLADVQRWESKNDPQHAKFVFGKQKPFLASAEVARRKQEVHTATETLPNKHILVLITEYGNIFQTETSGRTMKTKKQSQSLYGIAKLSSPN
ncbi:hypothetical protein J6590_063115 [Homalodisca vitripennis]|nr:hypothetical protein J6590_063115 [Homalodisca vitripennis]